MFYVPDREGGLGKIFESNANYKSVKIKLISLLYYDCLTLHLLSLSQEESQATRRPPWSHRKWRWKIVRSGSRWLYSKRD
jgi:hypothetical protein